MTKGGDFKMGHDARHKSNLIKEALSGTNPEAVAELETRGWTKFLAKRQEIEARPRTESRPRPVIEDDEEKALNAHARILLMKAAGLVLKATGQYHRNSPHWINIPGADEAAAIIEGTYAELLLAGHPLDMVWSSFTPPMVEACRRERGRFLDDLEFAAWLDRQITV